MARTRLIKPAFFLNEQLADLPYEYRLLFIGLWTEADREGRLLRRPKRLKASLFPYDTIDVEAGLAALAKAGLVVQFASGDDTYVEVLAFARHQHPHVKEPASQFPSAFDASSTNLAPGKTRSRTKPALAQHHAVRADTDTDTDTDTDADAATVVAPPPPVLTYPCQGAEREWHLTASQLETWQQLYPQVDVLGECRKALAHVLAKGPKTARGMPAFLVAWLNRSVSWGGRGAVPAPKVDSWDTWRPSDEAAS